MEEESLVDRIDGSLEEVHRRFAEKWQDWTGVSDQKLAGMLYATSAAAALGDFAMHPDQLHILLPILAAVNLTGAVRPPHLPKHDIVNTMYVPLYLIVVPISAVLAAQKLFAGDYSGILVGIWPASTAAADYVGRVKLNPPGEGRIHKALSNIKQYLTNLIPAPAPAQTL